MSEQPDWSAEPGYPERCIRMLKAFKAAANDDSLSDRQFRSIVLYLSIDPLTQRDIDRTRELAEKYGWFKS